MSFHNGHEYDLPPSKHQPRVILANQSQLASFRVPKEKVAAVICHRHDNHQQEQYLIKWNVYGLDDDESAYSWHNLKELAHCLAKVQEYLERDGSTKNGVTHLDNEDVINGVLTRKDGIILVKPIRIEFNKKLCREPAFLEVKNQYDGSTPPLDFQFINECTLGEGVVSAEQATVIGCGKIKNKTGSSGAMQRCGPNMGQDIGCEYPRVCECLEFAAVNKSALVTDSDRERDARGETEGLPKRFPYGSKSQLLTKFYLDSRSAIYECNRLCECGPGCRTRVVQKGRTAPLEIFKTASRGWGLRCKTDLKRGQFIDTYRGEIITDAEATRRERDAVSGLKASYLYSLDKHVGQNGLTQEDCYVIDGEFQGGPTRFINHSCDPNMRQFTVSYNKYDAKIYELAFFACRDIEAEEELTFDYLDKDDDDESDDSDDHLDPIQPQQDAFASSSSQDRDNGGGSKGMQCFCGSENCRGTLWI